MTTWRVIGGDVREKLAELCGLFASLVQLKASKLSKENVRLRRELWRQWLESDQPKVLAGWRQRTPQRVQFKAYLYLPLFALDVRQNHSQQRDGFLLDKSEPVVGHSSAASVDRYSFGVWKERVDEINRTPIRHGKFKPDYIGRRSPLWSRLSLQSYVTFGVNHSSQVSKLPVGQCGLTVHTQ